MFKSTKKFGPISTGHRQWLHDGHCSWVHGYGRNVQITFACNQLDERGWVMDFGGLKEVKKFLEDEWDHRTLISEHDPLLPDLLELQEKGGININVMYDPYGPGIEQSCLFVFDNVNDLINQKSNRVWVEKVEIWEHENNSAYYSIND